jgi:hypothetical protein
MNLPNSLALPRSKFFQSRAVLFVLLGLLLLIAAGVFVLVRPLAPLKSATVATSPDAAATPRPVAKPPVPAPVVYGPPAPPWVERVPTTAAAPPAAAGAVPAAGSAAAVIPVPGTQAGAVPGVGGTAGAASLEAPQSLGASVLFARERYVYTGGSRRDPFLSLLDGKFQGQGDGSLVDVGDMHLVGVMWGSADKFALVEDSRGRAYVLRVGDPVVNGYISGITKTEIQVVQNAFGESQMLSIQLKPKEGDKNATPNP